MIPTYEPSDYLLATLASVIEQDMGSDRMQIVIVDDASQTADVTRLISNAKLSHRVTVIKNPVNLGLAGNWNRCIEYARGTLIHILHQDDLVLPGFYSTMCNAMRARPDIGMAFSRCALIDGDGRVTEYSRYIGRSSDVIDNWIERITRRNAAHCAAVVVRRSVYQQLGGYRTDLKYALDWEMWVRIAAKYPVWYEPRPLASYRRHARNETTRLTEVNETYRDELSAMRAFANHIPEDRRARLMAKAYSRIACSRLRRANKLLRNNDIARSRHMIQVADEAIAQLQNFLPRQLITLRSVLLKSRIWLAMKLSSRGGTQAQLH